MQKYNVKIQTSYRDCPEKHELSAALLIANHFKKDIMFLRTDSKKTPDLLIGKEFWELKSPRGNSKNTIRNNLSTAKQQSGNIILDLRRTNLRQTKVVSHVKYYISQGHKSVKRVKIITKDGKIVDIL